jgi:hypothetical protein
MEFHEPRVAGDVGDEQEGRLDGHDRVSGQK